MESHYAEKTFTLASLNYRQFTGEVLVMLAKPTRARQNRQPPPFHLEKTGGFGTNQHQRRGAEAAGWKTSRFVRIPGSLRTVSPRKEGAFEFFCQP